MYMSTAVHWIAARREINRYYSGIQRGIQEKRKRDPRPRPVDHAMRRRGKISARGEFHDLSQVHGNSVPGGQRRDGEPLASRAIGESRDPQEESSRSSVIQLKSTCGATPVRGLAVSERLVMDWA